MPEDCIDIIPPEGYPKQKNYSIKAARWINEVEIRHALNGGEKICGHYVDEYHPDSKTRRQSSSSTDASGTTHFPDRNRINPHNYTIIQQLYTETV